MNDTQGTKLAGALRGKVPVGLGRLLRRAFFIALDCVDAFANSVGSIPSHTIRLLMYRHLLGMQIGVGTSIHRACRLLHPASVVIGMHTVINRNVMLDGRRGISIGDNVSLSEGSCFITLEHDLESPSFDRVGAPIIIEDYVFVGLRAIVLPGVRLGKGCAVAAGSVVTKSVPPFSIVGGVPARFIRRRSEKLSYTLHFEKFLE